MSGGNGSGPGGHPGVYLAPMTGDEATDKAALEAGFEAKKGNELVGFYTAGGNTFAVFANGYK